MVCDRLTPDVRQSRPADVLVADWERGRPAAWDVTVTSPLTPALLNEVGMTASAAAAFTEQHNHTPMIQLGGCVFPWLSRLMANGGVKHTLLLLVWPLSLQSVLLCRNVGSLMTFMGDLDWCCQGAWQKLFWQESCPNLLNRKCLNLS